MEQHKSAITTPIEVAKNKVKSVVDAIKGFFSGMKISLPHINLPHFKVTGKLSIAPPSVPHLSIDWYKEGGIMTSPTIFGMNGSSLMAGGEAGAEAILPLAGFYKQLEAMISSHLNTSAMENIWQSLLIIPVRASTLRTVHLLAICSRQSTVSSAKLKSYKGGSVYDT